MIMKKYSKLMNSTELMLALVLVFSACKKSSDTNVNLFAGITYQTEDQMARPAINTVFNVGADKDAYNTTIPSAMGAGFQSKFQQGYWPLIRVIPPKLLV